MKALDRCFLTTCLPAALIAAVMLWAMPARAQGDTPKPTTAPPSTGTKSLGDLKPKTIDADIDPCKVKNPPSYCAKH